MNDHGPKELLEKQQSIIKDKKHTNFRSVESRTGLIGRAEWDPNDLINRKFLQKPLNRPVI